MKRATLSAFALAVVLAAAAPAPLAAQDEVDDDAWIEDCREQDDSRAVECAVRVESMPATASLAVDPDQNGGVVFRGWDADRIEVHARITARADDAATARALADEVEIEMRPGSVRASVPRRENVSATLVILVPRRIDVSAEATNGPVAARGIEGRIDLRTTNGPVSLREVAGDVTARSKNGPIHVTLSGSRWTGTGLDAETRNGPVHLEIPDGYSAELETGTKNGPFRSDIALTLPPGTYGRGPLAVRLGAGGAPVRVTTTNGPVTIERR